MPVLYVADGLILRGKVLRSTRRELSNGAIRYRVTVLAGRVTESLELYDVPEAAVPAIGSQLDQCVAVRCYVDKQGMARYSLQMAHAEGEF